MQASLRALLDDVVDYAGLFPPAKLDLDQAIRNYARYCQAPESWMLGRFVCPASRLGELGPYVDELFKAGPVLRISVLGRSGQSCAQFLEGMKSDLKDLAEFRAHTDERTAIEAFETRLPGDTSKENEVAQLLDAVSELRDARHMGWLSAFYEPPPKTDWRLTWPEIIRGIAEHGAAADGGPDARKASKLTGFKLRCGGPDPSAQVSVEQVASAICRARAARVPVKFTAGLHHPLRHYDKEAGAHMHGFINVFAAGILAASGDVDEAQVRCILASEDVESFEFTADAMSWNGNRISCDGIARARRSAITSFGSCSFDEPREGLRSLSLL